jgi:hypothetical protein
MAMPSFSDVFALLEGEFGAEKEVEEVKKHQKVLACTAAAVLSMHYCVLLPAFVSRVVCCGCY